MLKLSEQEIIQRIRAGEMFECQAANGSFTLKIDAYTPIICTAVHAGHQLRANLVEKCALSAAERLYEEDPFTDQLIQAMPITIVGLDSRYEYDLNRPIANCIYTTAWGKQVWRKKLTAKERNDSGEKHRGFYRVLDALVGKLEAQFGATLMFDVHSYNFLRRTDATPTFNLGTEQIDHDRWRSMVNLTLDKLNKVELSNLPVVACENGVFYGRGYMIAHINSRFQNTLVLPIEVKKIFMDELTGDIYPLVMQALTQQFKSSLVDIATVFAKRFTHLKRSKRASLLTDTKDPAIVHVDKTLYRLAKGLETLLYINPINIPAERKIFYKHKGNYQPQFRYRQLNIDPYLFKEQLYRVPVDTINDPSIQSMYRDVVNGLSEKIDMLVKTGQPDFLYESLRYYGEPSQMDEQNAQFLLHASPLEFADDSRVSSPELLTQMEQAAADWHMTCRVETSNKLVASAMVSNRRRAVLIANNLNLSQTEANALVHHELGVHMATTLNAAKQDLKVFSLGLPGNTLTQEGLAILNEFQSGNMTLKRLQGLALRVLAVRHMLQFNDFRQTFSYLCEEHRLPDDDAFKLTVRVYRGGGFTKDYLYLNGVSKALAMYQSQNITNLYVGKTGFAYLPVINEMIERQLITAPVYYPTFLEEPMAVPPVLEYLMRCIRSTPNETPERIQLIKGVAA